MDVDSLIPSLPPSRDEELEDDGMLEVPEFGEDIVEDPLSQFFQSFEGGKKKKERIDVWGDSDPPTCPRDLRLPHGGVIPGQLIKEGLFSPRPAVTSTMRPPTRNEKDYLRDPDPRLFYEMAWKALGVLRKFTTTDWIAFWWLGRTPLSLLFLHSFFYRGEGVSVEELRKRLNYFCRELVLDRLDFHFFTAKRSPRLSRHTVLYGDKGGLFDCYFLGPFGFLIQREMGYEPAYNVYWLTSSATGTTDIASAMTPATVIGVVAKVVHQYETTKLVLWAFQEERERKNPPFRIKAWYPERAATRSFFAPPSSKLSARMKGKRVVRKVVRPDGILELVPASGGLFRCFLEYTFDDESFAELTQRLERKLRIYLGYWKNGDWRACVGRFPPVLFFCDGEMGLGILTECLMAALDNIRSSDGLLTWPFSIYVSCFDWLSRTPFFSCGPWRVVVKAGHPIPPREGRRAKVITLPLLTFEKLMREESYDPLAAPGWEEVRRAVRRSALERTLDLWGISPVADEEELVRTLERIAEEDREGRAALKSVVSCVEEGLEDLRKFEFAPPQGVLPFDPPSVDEMVERFGRLIRRMGGLVRGKG